MNENIISIENMEFYSYHGCFKEEKIIGNKFIVSIDMETDFNKSALEDDINLTVNYQTVYEIIKREMDIKSNIIENVAKRIINSIFDEFKMIKYINLVVSKLNPPIGGKIEKVSVRIIEKRVK
ncbi:MAG: dihydroneopterin aldolase [Bacteroidota bacterium]|nr:dihydroneopterin aldolase [Bacteroidota bacterium]